MRWAPRPNGLQRRHRRSAAAAQSDRDTQDPRARCSSGCLGPRGSTWQWRCARAAGGPSRRCWGRCTASRSASAAARSTLHLNHWQRSLLEYLESLSTERSWQRPTAIERPTWSAGDVVQDAQLSCEDPASRHKPPNHGLAWPGETSHKLTTLRCWLLQDHRISLTQHMRRRNASEPMSSCNLVSRCIW